MHVASGFVPYWSQSRPRSEAGRIVERAANSSANRDPIKRSKSEAMAECNIGNGFHVVTDGLQYRSG